MADIHIRREHGLSRAAARKIALTWAEQAEQEFAMECVYEKGLTVDVLTFTRSGVKGSMEVDKDRFELEANLGFLLGAFKGRIEAEIVKNLDTLLNAKAVKKPTRKSTVA